MTDLSGTTLLNRYDLRQKIGSGGMSDVYLAGDRKRSTQMAIKVLRRDLGQSTHFFQMFTREAGILRKLEHPNIVRIYEFERDGEFCFIVMDYIEGTNLSRAMEQRRRPYTLPEAAHVLNPVCSALNYAHINQVYHCDIKPGNILMHVDGRVLLSDFGVAHLASDTTAGGTPLYMAPEQFTGSMVDGRTDVYALGVTVFQMFSGGSVPFAGRTPQSQGTTTRAKIAWEHLYLALPPLSLYNSYPPPGLDELIQTAMHKNPKKRFQTAIEFYSAFERICQNEAGDTRRWPSNPPSPPPPVPPSPSPSPPPQISEKSKYPVPAPTLRGPVLFVRSGDYSGQVIPIPKDNAGLTIGRSSQMRLCLGERSISRTHATILLGAKGVYLRDENSTGGTLVNGARISGVVLLHPGDIIQIGSQQVFEFQNR